MMTKMSVSQLTGELQALASKGPDNVPEGDRKQLLEACNNLRRSFETPTEAAYEAMFSAHQGVAIRLGIDMGLFNAAATACGGNFDGGKVTVQQLAETTNVDPVLVLRVMRHLAAMDVFKDLGNQVFTPTPFAAVFVSENPMSAGIISMTACNRVIYKLPEYFAEKGWKNPDNDEDGPFQFAMNTTSNIFDYLAANPFYQQVFNRWMSLSSSRYRGRPWFDFFPVKEKLQPANPSEPVIVDVGGNDGLLLDLLKKRYPDLSGGLISQDLPVVIGTATRVPESVEAQCHDFFQEQPVKGAKAYFMRTILHDWGDKRATQILDRIRDAMGPESLLLINERLMPDSNVPLPMCQIDMTMMATCASMERTEKQFQVLLEKSGLELVKVWRPDGQDVGLDEDQESLLEARLRRV